MNSNFTGNQTWQLEDTLFIGMFRCFAHSSQRSPETCLKSYTPMKKWVAPAHPSKALWLAAAEFLQAAEWFTTLNGLTNELESLFGISGQVASGQFLFPGGTRDFRWQGAGSIRISPVPSLSTRIAACGNTVNARWARETLKLFDVDELLLLGLVTEFVQVAERFVHAWGSKSEGTFPQWFPYWNPHFQWISNCLFCLPEGTYHTCYYGSVLTKHQYDKNNIHRKHCKRSHQVQFCHQVYWYSLVN